MVQRQLALEEMKPLCDLYKKSFVVINWDRLVNSTNRRG